MEVNEIPFADRIDFRVMLSGHPWIEELPFVMFNGISLQKKEFFLSYGYVVHKRKWWQIWGKEKIEVFVGLTNQGVLMRQWSSLSPSIIICYFEQDNVSIDGQVDAALMLDSYENLAKNAYYHGVR